MKLWKIVDGPIATNLGSFKEIRDAKKNEKSHIEDTLVVLFDFKMARFTYF